MAASGAKGSLYPQQRENTSQSLRKDKREQCPTQKHDFLCFYVFLWPCFSMLFLHLTKYDKCVQGEQPSYHQYLLSILMATNWHCHLFMLYNQGSQCLRWFVWLDDLMLLSLQGFAKLMSKIFKTWQDIFPFFISTVVLFI